MSKKISKDKLEQIKKDSFTTSESFVSQADKWLRDNGIITPVLHNNIIINLYVHFPKAKYIEYFMDPDAHEIEIYFYLPKINHFLTKESSLERRAQQLLTEYLPNFKVTARKRRHGVDSPVQ